MFHAMTKLASCSSLAIVPLSPSSKKTSEGAAVSALSADSAILAAAAAWFADTRIAAVHGGSSPSSAALAAACFAGAPANPRHQLAVTEARSHLHWMMLASTSKLERIDSMHCLQRPVGLAVPFEDSECLSSILVPPSCQRPMLFLSCALSTSPTHLHWALCKSELPSCGNISNLRGNHQPCHNLCKQSQVAKQSQVKHDQESFRV